MHMDWHAFLSAIGELSITYVWIPLGLWTLAAIPLFMLTRRIAQVAPRIHYLSCLALLIALPAGFLAMPWTSTVLQPVLQPVQQLVSFPAINTPARITSANTGPSTTGNSDTSRATRNTSVAAAPALAQTAKHGPALVGTLTLIALLASVFGLLNMGFQWFSLNPLMARFAPVKHPGAVAQLESTAKKLQISRQIRFKRGPEHIAPFTYGFFRPSIVVPASILEEKEALRTALYHELIHVKRNDYGAGLVVHFLAACFVFHPMVWLLSRHITTYRELSCDKTLLQQTNTSPADYARLLLRFNQHNRLQYVVSMRRSKSDLKQRVQSMADYPDSPLAYERKWARSLMLCIGLLLPAIVMSCSEKTPTTGLMLTHESTGALEELGITMQVAEGWFLTDSSRTTAGNSWQRGFEAWPSDIHYIYERRRPKPETPDELLRGTNGYRLTNLLSFEDYEDWSYGKRTDFYQFDLEVTYEGTNHLQALELWKEGKCLYSDSPEPQLCKRTTDTFQMTYQLSEAELPPALDAGYIYEHEFRYGNEPHMVTKWLTCFLYAVKDTRRYQIEIRAFATDPEKAHLITTKTLLQEPAIAAMLASIQFE